MLRVAFQSVALTAAIALSNAATTFAQVTPTLPRVNFPVAQVANFSCGPHLLTYVVKPIDQRAGKGIRCVKISEGKPGTTIPQLAWYGEGNWGGATYRHVGHAFYRGSNLIGYASDIHGNGENIQNNFPGNLAIQVTAGSFPNPTQIQVKGAWNETWSLVRATNYTPLSRPQTCGRYFDEYKVSDLTGNRRGSGLRCVLKVGLKNTTWFGNGQWGGSTYSHLGTRSFNGYGAGDICATGLGPICNTFGWGSLKFASVLPKGFNVTGAWSEKWR
jgi:hypothetical protein